MAKHGRNLIMYRVFDWNYDNRDHYFDYFRDAKKRYIELIKKYPEGNWRLYRDTEAPAGSGNFQEDCLFFNADNDATLDKEGYSTKP